MSTVTNTAGVLFGGDDDDDRRNEKRPAATSPENIANMQQRSQDCWLSSHTYTDPSGHLHQFVCGRRQT